MTGDRDELIEKLKRALEAQDRPPRRVSDTEANPPGATRGDGMRTFTGWRRHPRPEYAPAGLSNAGASPDYWGCIFPDGTVVVRWATAYRSHSVWACWDDFYHVHGHEEYGTLIEFGDGQPEPEPGGEPCI